MKKTVKLGLALVSSTLALSANAATPGAYVGAGLGVSSVDAPKLDTTGIGMPVKTSTTTKGLAGRIFAGYNFNEYVGLEIGADNFAQSSFKVSGEEDVVAVDAKSTYKQRAIDLVAKGYLPISDSGFSAYALGGVAETYNKRTLKSSNFNDSTSYKKLRPKFGVGVNYAVDQNVNASFEISRIQGKGDFKKDEHAVANADMAALTISYNFG